MSASLPPLRHAALLFLLAGASTLAQAVVTVTGSRSLRVGESVLLRAQRPGHPDQLFRWIGHGSLSIQRRPFRFDAMSVGSFLIGVSVADAPWESTTMVIQVLPRAEAPRPPSGRHLWTLPVPTGDYRALKVHPSGPSLWVGTDSRLQRFDLSSRETKEETVLDLEVPVPGMAEAAQMEQVCVAPDGSAFFTVWAHEAANPQPQVWHRAPDGKLTFAAGRSGESLAEGVDPENEAMAPVGQDVPHALVPCDLNPWELVAGPDGACYFTDRLHEQVLRLRRLPGGGFDLAVIAGLSPDAVDLLDEKAYEAAHGDCQDARQAVLDTLGLATGPDGSLVLLTRDGRLCWLQRGTGSDPETWRLNVLFAPAEEDPDRPGEPFPTGMPKRDCHRLVVDGLGFVYLAGLNGGRIWSSTTPVGAGTDRLTFIPVAGTDPQDEWQEGAPAERLKTPSCLFLAPLPGGGLLLSGGLRQPIRYLGPPSDAHLVPWLRAYARRDADGKGCDAAFILDNLRKRLADPQGQCRIFLAPLTRNGRDVLDHLVDRDRLPLPQDLAELIRAFVLDPFSNAFRAARAVRLLTEDESGSSRKRQGTEHETKQP